MNIAHALANSFRNFHAKGMDYICLQRSPDLTIKLYVFDGDVSKIPEVVNPHDHRYDFDTTVLHGAMQNITYTRSDTGKLYQEFQWQTPLNGGNGFTWSRESMLAETGRLTLGERGSYRMRADGIHTIRITENETILRLLQFEDVIPVDQPTATFTLNKEPPALDGLYERWTEGALMDRLRRIDELTGMTISREMAA